MRCSHGIFHSYSVSRLLSTRSCVTNHNSVLAGRREVKLATTERSRPHLCKYHEIFAYLDSSNFVKLYKVVAFAFYYQQLVSTTDRHRNCIAELSTTFALIFVTLDRYHYMKVDFTIVFYVVTCRFTE